MRSVLLVLLVLGGCGGSKEDRCTKIRDQAAPLLERNVRDALGAIDPEHRAEIEAQGAKELALFRANFVKVCAAQDDATVKCLEDGARDPAAKPSEDCETRTDAVWGKVYTP